MVWEREGDAWVDEAETGVRGLEGMKKEGIVATVLMMAT